MSIVPHILQQTSGGFGRTKRIRDEDNVNVLYRSIAGNPPLFIPRNETAVSSSVCNDEAPLMWRNSAIDMFNTLTAFVGGRLPIKGPVSPVELDEPAETLIIRGNPGCGKTLTTWMLLKEYVCLDQHPCIWYNLRLGTLLHITPIVNTTDPAVIGHMTSEKAPLSQISSKEYNLCIIDSISQSTIDKFLCDLNSIDRQYPLILVTSMQTDLHDDVKHELKAREYTLRPWTLDDYIECCRNDDFFRSVFDNLNDTDMTLQEFLDDPDLRTMLVHRKYKVAGVCARWMFDLTYDEVYTKIVSYVKKVNNYSAFLDAIVGPELSDAVNVLFYPSDDENNNGKNAFTSDLVLRILIENKDIKTILDNAAILARNFNHPGLDSIVFEAELIDWVIATRSADLDPRLLKVECIPRPTSTCSFTSNELYRSQVFKFHQDILTEEEYHKFLCLHDWSNSPEGIWFIPDVYNEGGFDLVHIARRNGELCMVFLQVTRQISHHKVKLHHFRQFLQSYNLLVPQESQIATIIVQVVVPFSKYTSYHLPTSSEIEDERVLTRVRLKTQTIQFTIKYELVAFKRSQLADILST